MIFLKKATRYLTPFIFLLAFILYGNNTCAQFRQLHVEPDENHALKLSFYTGGEGYVAFTRSVGFTTDSGKTFQQKKITLNNVNYGNYNVNLTFGFGILGVKAFDQNNILVYGHYGLVPAILSSADAGATFKLVYHDQYGVVPNSGITDIVFPENKNTGYAVDNDRILKTVNGGQNWAVSYAATNNNFIAIQALNNTQLIAFGAGGQLFRTADGGATWQQIAVQGSYLRSVYFLNTTIGWSGDNEGNVYYTSNSGASWAKQNTIMGTSLRCYKLKFVNDSTGYALTDGFNVYKTSDRGKIWEPLPRDNNYAYLGYTLNDFQFNGNTVWTAGGHGQIQVSSNSGGTPIPTPLFTIDTTGVAGTRLVNLKNLSKTGNIYKWQVNGKNISTAYNAQYTHDIFSTYDTVRLIVSNNQSYADTLTQYQVFQEPVIISSFTPLSGSTGTKITITGINFRNVKKVNIGGIPAASFTVVSPTTILAIVGAGASGNIVVVTTAGGGSKGGFTFVPPPSILSFLPATAKAGDVVTLTGSNFTGATAVSFGGTPAASFTVVSATQIKAVVGGGGAGRINVVAPGGTATIANFKMVPVIASFTPDKGTDGTVITIKGTGFSDANYVTIGGSPARSFSVDSATSITAVVGPGAAGVVKVTTPGGSSTTTSVFTYFKPPVIISFSPLTGPVGTTVTIKGVNFDPVPSKNVVFVGQVKVPVITANASTLTVKVPVGVTYNPITVAVNNLQSYAAQPFTLTFDGGGSITPNSFISDTTIFKLKPAVIKQIADVDGDGMADVILSTPINSITVLRNVGTPGNSSYEPVDLSATVDQALYYGFGDVDGDGLTDILARGLNGIVVYKNACTPGKILFLPPVTISNIDISSNIFLQDMNGDGKPDMVVMRYNAGESRMAILKNKSEPGNISFYAPVFFDVFLQEKVILNDFDNDGIADVLGQLRQDGERFSVIKNYSTPGAIDIPANGQGGQQLGSSRGVPTLFDADNDGRMDIAVVYSELHLIYIFKNISTPGTLKFESKVILNIVDEPAGIVSNDLDGDGKPELLLNYYRRKNISVFKNLSVGSNIAFSKAIELPTIGEPGGVVIGDINNDGRNDILYTSDNDKPDVLINNIKPVPFISNFTPGAGGQGTKITISGINLSGVTTVKIGDVNAASFTITNDKQIIATVGSGASGAVNLTNSYGSASMVGFVYSAPPVITSVSPLSGPAGTQVTISGNNFDPGPDKNIVYFGDVKATVTAATPTTLTVTAPAQATYKPISVTTNKLIAYASFPFSLTYPNGFSKFNSQSFNVRQSLRGAAPGTGDLDGDGKPDLIYMGGSNYDDLVVARNITPASADTASFAPAQVIGPFRSFSFNLIVTDMNADGKLDIIYLQSKQPATFASTLCLVLNTSTPGQISFSPPIKFNDIADNPAFDGFPSVEVNDIDGDGLPDIVTSNYSYGIVYVFRNITAQGKLRFGQRADYKIFDGYVDQVKLGDINGDGKVDLIVGANYDTGKLSVFKNNSVKGIISFEPYKSFSASGWPSGINLADLDGDKKIDVLLSPAQAGRFDVYHNTTQANGVFNFTRSPMGDRIAVSDAMIADLNGDAKPDVLVNGSISNPGLTLIKNFSTSGTIDFGDNDIYYAVNAGNASAVSDVDLDGRPDILTSIDGKIIILLNKTKPPLNLPGKNLRAEFVSATCKGANNGMINITATSQQNYYVTINKLGFGTSKNFTKTLSVTDLAPGEYNVCITVDGYPEFQQCFTGTITEPKDLSVYAAVDPSSKNVVLSLSGGTGYQITLNDTRLETSEQVITLALHNGNNRLQVSTGKDCQGVFSEIINVGGKITPYPNPFTNLLQIDIAESNALAAEVEVIDAFGKRRIKQTVKPGNGKIELDVSGLQSGVYVLRLLLDNKLSVYKIWKR